MQPLLRIQTVPIAISYSTTRAQLRQNTQQPRAEVTRVRGKQDIRNEFVKVRMDNYEMRASMGLKTAPRVIQEAAQTGRADALEATRNLVEEGNRIVDSNGKGNPIPENAHIRWTKVMNNVETIMSFIPSQRPQMWTEGGTISFDYTMDRLEYDWQVQSRPEMEFVPGNVEFTVSQYPEVIIEYLGAPVYVPPSADPNYEPPPSLDGSV